MHGNSNATLNVTEDADGGGCGAAYTYGKTELYHQHNQPLKHSSWHLKKEQEQLNLLNHLEESSNDYYRKSASGNLTYRVSPLSLINLDMARTVSRPELVVEGLKDMCNLVEEAEPESPNAKTRSRHWLGHSPKFTSPPIPPPTAFDAGLIATEGIFSSLGEGIHPEEIRNYSLTTTASFSKPSGHSLRQVQSKGQTLEDEAKICQVLQNMISHMGGFDEEEEKQGDQSPSSSPLGPGAARGAMSSTRNQLNGVSDYRSSRFQATNESTDCIEYEQYCPPQLPTFYQHQHLDINQNPYVQTKPKAFAWDGTQMTQHHQPTTIPRLQQPQQMKNNCCQCNLIRQQEQLEHGHGSDLEDKTTSTSDIPTAMALPFIVMQQDTQSKLILQHPTFPQQIIVPSEHQHLQQCSKHLLGGCSSDYCALGGSGQHRPIYILQTTSNQQTPIFVVQNPTGATGNHQNPIFLQQVQCQQIPLHHQTNSPEQVQSQVTTVKATRVETRTTVQNSSSTTNPQAYEKYEYVKHLVSGGLQQQINQNQTKSLQKKPGHIQLQFQPGQNQCNSKRSNGISDPDEEDEVTFIVGPSPVESMHEFEIIRGPPHLNHHQQKNHFKPSVGSPTAKDPGKQKQGPSRTGESYSDTQVNRVRMQLKNKKLAQGKSYHPGPNLEQDDQYDAEGYIDDDGPGQHGRQELATPTTSSHTITLKTNVRRGENRGIPCISSEEEQNDQGDAVVHTNSNRAYQDPSTSSIIEPEPPVRTRNITKNIGCSRKNKWRKPSALQKTKDQDEDFEIHGLYPTLEPLDSWTSPEPGFMRDKKSVIHQQRDHDSVTEKSVTEGIALIEDGSSWERNVCGLRVISLQVQFHEVAVLERLPSLVTSIQKHIRASGSKLARQAILTLRDLFTILGPHFDTYLHSLSERLFSKMANTNKFIKNDCEATLESMVEHCSQPKMITILENVARRHKHCAIRLVACKMITKFIGLVGPVSALEDYAHLILPLLCCNLAERTGEIRDEARNGLRLLIPNPDFDAYMRHNVSPQFIFTICEKLERIRDEMSDRPRIRRKISHNRSLFKWQQKYSHTNMM